MTLNFDNVLADDAYHNLFTVVLFPVAKDWLTCTKVFPALRTARSKKAFHQSPNIGTLNPQTGECGITCGRERNDPIHKDISACILWVALRLADRIDNGFNARQNEMGFATNLAVESLCHQWCVTPG